MAVTPEALRHFISVLDGAPCTPPQPACGACKSVWFCTCRHQENPFDWAEIAMRAPRQTTEPRPMPTPPVATANQKHLLEDQSVRQCKRSRKSEPPLLACNREVETRLHLCLPTQQCWEEVKDLLPSKVLHSCAGAMHAMLKACWNDCQLHVQLPSAKDYLLHGKRVVDQIPRGCQFKIGMTCSPKERFYEGPYAYANSSMQRRDKVNYQGMIIFYVHRSQHILCPWWNTA